MGCRIVLWDCFETSCLSRLRRKAGQSLSLETVPQCHSTQHGLSLPSLKWTLKLVKLWLTFFCNNWQESVGQDTVGYIIIHNTDWITVAALKMTINPALRILVTASESIFAIWSFKLVCFILRFQTWLSDLFIYLLIQQPLWGSLDRVDMKGFSSCFFRFLHFASWIFFAILVS